jgi:hypothetical protein
MNLIIRNNGLPDYRMTRKMNREEAFEELKLNLKNKIAEKLAKVDRAFLW